ncbi:histidine phosphatase family protein [Desulfosporosinus sp. BICA1-9]|uniref:histidine phosphatase family protein n=1 Tax=Desulfosporosinus sp. BICA1-9 TaxID=1531958 RepID=UPI00054BB457|nr:histidine phosphatase family protein [Desulfosporosinus sp. BICA1-9]KJS49084.1 MAG: fructose-2,6-bisphosphatase [Peptococcaceae bacterium BRH_c23]KJS88883.1 MAG: fructose-2,6-bisphosphatase [Desulfosporosinus sp. BICA1-9]HBW36678.1 histidine phosphatase family protein [Desulfosporosinus sp.]
MTRIILTRHGQTLWNIEGRVQGSLDSPLTEKGILQARSLALRLKNERIDHIYSSDSQRAIGTAEEIRLELGLGKLSLNPALREFSFGEWEGCIWQELRETYPDIFKIWDSEPHLVTTPGGENMTGVMERAWNFVQHIIQAHSGETVCLVTHGLTLKLLITKALGFEVHEWAKTPWQHNTALNILEVEGQKWIPSILADCQHLEGLEELADQESDPKK